MIGLDELVDVVGVDGVHDERRVGERAIDHAHGGVGAHVDAEPTQFGRRALGDLERQVLGHHVALAEQHRHAQRVAARGAQAGGELARQQPAADNRNVLRLLRDRLQSAKVVDRAKRRHVRRALVVGDVLVAVKVRPVGRHDAHASRRAARREQTALKEHDFVLAYQHRLGVDVEICHRGVVAPLAVAVVELVHPRSLLCAGAIVERQRFAAIVARRT